MAAIYIDFQSQTGILFGTTEQSWADWSDLFIRWFCRMDFQI